MLNRDLGKKHLQDDNMNYGNKKYLQKQNIQDDIQFDQQQNNITKEEMRIILWHLKNESVDTEQISPPDMIKFCTKIHVPLYQMDRITTLCADKDGCQNFEDIYKQIMRQTLTREDRYNIFMKEKSTLTYESKLIPQMNIKDIIEEIDSYNPQLGDFATQVKKLKGKSGTVKLTKVYNKLVESSNHLYQNDLQEVFQSRKGSKINSRITQNYGELV